MMEMVMMKVGGGAGGGWDKEAAGFHVLNSSRE